MQKKAIRGRKLKSAVREQRRVAARVTVYVRLLDEGTEGVSSD